MGIGVFDATAVPDGVGSDATAVLEGDGVFVATAGVGVPVGTGFVLVPPPSVVRARSAAEPSPEATDVSPPASVVRARSDAEPSTGVFDAIGVPDAAGVFDATAVPDGVGVFDATAVPEGVGVFDPTGVPPAAGVFDAMAGVGVPTWAVGTGFVLEPPPSVMRARSAADPSPEATEVSPPASVVRARSDAEPSTGVFEAIAVPDEAGVFDATAVPEGIGVFDATGVPLVEGVFDATAGVGVPTRAVGTGFVLVPPPSVVRARSAADPSPEATDVSPPASVVRARSAAEPSTGVFEATAGVGLPT